MQPDELVNQQQLKNSFSEEECPIDKAIRQLETKESIALNNSLYKAILEQDLSAIQVAIESGANVNATDGTVKKRGFFLCTNASPLELLIDQALKDKISEANALSILDILIKAGVNCNKELKKIIRMHERSCDYFDKDKWINYLLDRTKDFSGLLHPAAKVNDSSTILTLIRKKADVNEISSGYSPLHVAVENNSFEAVEELLKAGASLTQRNRNNLTAFDIAIENNNLRLAAYITSRLNYSSSDDSKHRIQVNICNQLFRIGNLIEIYLYANSLLDEEDQEEEEYA